MSVAKLQRLLSLTATSREELRQYLTDLCNSIAASMISDPAILHFNVSVDDSTMTPDQSVSLGLIITELVINSLKHAFPDPKCPGKVNIDFRSSPAGWILSVIDDGVGIPAGHGDTKSGLGTGIVIALAGQLSATVAVSDAKPGTCVTVASSNAGPEPVTNKAV
jgi:two-component sensor histidine kinase